MLKRFLADETGATAIEYGLMAALISLVIVGVVSVIGTRIGAKLNFISSSLT